MKRYIAICVIFAFITSFLFQLDVLADTDTSGLTALCSYYNGVNYYDFYYAPVDGVQVYQFYKLLSTGNLGMKERSASIVFVSAQSTTMIVTQVFNKTKATTSTVNINATYSGEYSNASASSYWQSYIGQFLDDDTYDDFVEQMQEKNLYFGFYDTSNMSYYEYYTNMNASEHYFNCELQKLEVYPQVDGEKLYDDKISTLRDNYYSSSVIDHVAPFWYVPTNKDKPPYLPDDKNDSGSIIPDISFYLKSFNAKKTNIISQYWQSDWLLSWKNNTDIDISGWTVEIYASSGTVSDIQSYVNKIRPMFEAIEGDCAGKCVHFYTSSESDTYGADAHLSLSNYMIDYLEQDWRPLKNSVFHIFCRMKSGSTVTVWYDFLCSPDGSIIDTYTRGTSYDLNDSINLIDESTGNRTDGTIIDSNGGSVSPDANESQSVNYGSDPYNYTNVDSRYIVGTLSSVIDSVKNVPLVIGQLIPYIDNKLITLISASLGMIVLVGIVKWLL